MTNKKVDDIIKESIKEYLKYTFTEDEIKELGKSLAKIFADHNEVEARLKSVSTQIKAEITALEGTMTMLSEKIRSGYEHRNIDCERVLNYTLGSVTIIRLDTGEIIKERPMDAEERQKNLELQPKE